VNDARKGAEMFAPDNMNVPLFGVVENMAWFTPKQHPEEKYFLFGQGGGLTLAREFNTTLLAQIPLVQEVGEAAEKGGNLMDQDNASSTRHSKAWLTKWFTSWRTLLSRKWNMSMSIAIAKIVTNQLPAPTTVPPADMLVITNTLF